MNEAENTKTESFSTETSPKLRWQLLIKKRDRLLDKISFFVNSSKVSSSESIRLARRKVFEDYENSYELIQEHIDELSLTIEEADVNSKLCSDRFQALFTKFVQINDVDGTVITPSQNVNTTAIKQNISLPRLNLPSFNGNIDSWIEFSNMFEALIHSNASLSPIEKFQNLKSCLSGSALNIISNLNLSDANYEIAYKQLCDRYSNPRRLCSFYVNQILEFKPLLKSDYESLRKFVDIHSNCLAALHAQNLENLEDFLLVTILLNHLDYRTKMDFENSLTANKIPTCKGLLEFVINKTRAMEMSFSCSTSVNKPQLKINKPQAYSNKTHGMSLITTDKTALHQDDDNIEINSRSQTSIFPNVYTSKENVIKVPSTKRNISKCMNCDSDKHNIYSCTKFSQLTVEARYDAVREKKLCFRCLSPHFRNACKSVNCCRICNSPNHHTLLHYDKNFQVDKPIANGNESTAACNASSLDTTATCLLGTAIVIVFDNFNQPHSVRAVIDSASQITAITKNLLDRLHLKCKLRKGGIIGIGSNVTQCSSEVQLCISSLIQPHIRLQTKALVLPQITCNQPNENLNPELFTKFSNLKLADKEFHKSKPVDLLIGADLFLQTLSEQSKKFIIGNPGALNTRFGWVIMGNITPNIIDCEPASQRVSLLTTVDPIHQALQKFWEVEEVPNSCNEDPSKLFCEKLYTETTTQNTSGRYQVALPFKNQPVELGNNRDCTKKKYLSLERRLSLSKDVKQLYDEFMHQYIELGHMSIALNSSSYVIPHHCVMKPTSSTTCLHVVFNASAPCNDGVTLNESLHTGSNLQNELAHILLNFRANNVVVTSDIKMMYRQIEVREEDRQYQHIFYRPSPEEDVHEYKLNTVSYGMASSSYLSQRTILQLVIDHGGEFPLAANALRNHTYVDDIVTGASSLKEARALVQQLIDLTAKGGFELRKWASNMPDAISDLPDDFLKNPRVFSDCSESIKVLGFQWNPSSDTFSYHVLPFDRDITKRAILSYIAKLFDPLGLLSPVTFACKYFLKLLWLSNMDWDTPLTEELVHQWMKISDSFEMLSSIKIPRLIESINVNISLIGFCDASEKGYAACIYLHVATDMKFVCMHLIMSKTRVAPLKTVTIPRLELNGALLLAKLYNYVSTALSLTVSTVRLYSDAKLVLTWLRTPPHKLKIYVANRVIQTLSFTAPEFWFYISTVDNPADAASRGLSPEQLINHSLWWKGPSFLHVLPDDWPQKNVEMIDDLSELKPPTSVLVTSVLEKSELLEELEKYSSLHKTVRILAYIQKFINKCKHNTPHATSSKAISASEYRIALLALVKLNQEYYFSEALGLLNQSKVPTSMLSLSPFLDASGCIRVGGRLRHSSLSYDSKHPLLMPKACHLSNLICDQTHMDNLHVGLCTTQSIISRKFWIISARSLIRQQIHLCVRCTRLNSQPKQPIMSDLPSFRTNSAHVFSIVGVDFAGPFITKASPIRGAKTYKGYLALFVCLVVRAVHLEFVSELTTDAFLAALDRFVSRRGLPKHIHCDNGLNFVGASRKLSEIHEFISSNQDEIQTASSNCQIEWHFNPPYAPNFGGIWEAGIKSAKKLLKNVIGESCMTLEEYSTIFSRIEAILNSRPLLKSSTNPNEEMLTLTPGHFLIGRPLLQVVETPVDEKSSNQQRWTRLRQLSQHFWKRWSSEYLQTLIQRTKWKVQSSAPIQLGQIVVIKHFNSPPSTWPIGKIIKLHPGRDHVNRVTTVRTASGDTLLPINKLIVLPVA